MVKKAALFVVGLAVAGSTVYALVLRSGNTPAPTPVTAIATATETAAEPMPRQRPATWGQLVWVDPPVERPGFQLTIRTPPLVINGDPNAPVARIASRRTQKPRLAAALEASATLEGSSGVMASFKAPPPAEEPDDGLPHTPDREAIANVMGTVRGEIQKCYDRGMVPGEVDLVLTVDGDSGRVARASVSATSSTATCIQRVARTLQFPRFAKERITVRYPYRFR